jgi:hypothetical protein
MGDPIDPTQQECLNWDLLFDFHAMVETLKETDGIVNIRSKMHDPVPGFTIATIEHGLGIRIPTRIKSFYQVSDGLEFSWSYQKDGEVHPGGGAHLFDFATVFDHWLESLWRSDTRHPETNQQETNQQETNQPDEDELDFLWSLRGFDKRCDPQRSSMIVMCVEEEYPTYDLFVHDLDQRSSHLLELTFRDYFDHLLTSRGTFGWQALLTEDADFDHPMADEFFEVAERFFPDADLSAWRRARDP